MSDAAVDSPDKASGHAPVLLDEALAALAIRPSGCYLDATFGRGGHAARILEALGPAGQLIAVDRDPEAIAWGQRVFAQEPRLHLVRAPFSRLQSALSGVLPSAGIDGALMDLGVSSPQLDAPRRGFSFQSDGPLDMRMDPEHGPSAADWLATAEEAELIDVFKRYGEERFARRIARRLIRDRAEAPIQTTRQLADRVAQAVPRRFWEAGKHPATRVFQALRIQINGELSELELGLQFILENLSPSARIAVISFHSLEDRIVKRFLRNKSQNIDIPAEIPVSADHLQGPLRMVGKPITPTSDESARNPRARSARLRYAEARS